MEETLKQFTTVLADAIRNRDGTMEEINPQDFADRIRALPVLGAECDCIIYFNNTKPASVYGGTWQELPQGTFLRATGTNGVIASGIVTDGGSNTHSHSLGTPNDTNAYALLQWNAYRDGSGIGMLEGDYGDGFVPKTLAGSGSYSALTDTTPRSGAIQVVGSTKSASNEPLYKNCHIWRKIS